MYKAFCFGQMVFNQKGRLFNHYKLGRYYAIEIIGTGIKNNAARVEIISSYC